MRLLSLSLIGAVLAYLLYTASPSIHRTLTTIGALRRYTEGTAAGNQVVPIPDTVHCEDIHYHAPSGLLFTACEDNAETRFRWFPPLANFDDPELASRSRGSIHVIDPKTMLSRRLEFENFQGPFITHGIDVIQDTAPSDGGEAVYIFAVNHVPETQPSGQKGPKARSQLELFHHVIGSSTARHVRSIWHPLIRTPNDVFAESPTSLYVTNDHRYRDHGLLRTVEDLYFGARWTDIVRVRLDSLATADPAASLTAKVALSGLHNGNGLGHGRSEREMLISSCTSGVLHIGQLAANGNITIVDSVEIDHIADNPSYFADPFPLAPADDRSGFLETGMARAIDIGHTMRDPTAKDPAMVTYLRPGPTGWEKRVLFEDDGTRLRSASAAVLVAIDPADEPDKGDGSGARKAWLFATGFLSRSIVALKVDL